MRLIEFICPKCLIKYEKAEETRKGIIPCSYCPQCGQEVIPKFLAEILHNGKNLTLANQANDAKGN